MQVDDIAALHDDLDNDSLFGSPPPSPARGRSPSPLALPSGQNIVQNVGTLALPGSHLCSELPSAPTIVHSAIPPRQTVGRQNSQPLLSAQTATSQRSATVPPRTASPLPRSLPVPRKTKRASKRSTPASEARPTPPPITLPSSTGPPPANFLRNQQALLGLAGLVGGINPANLSVSRPPRGESASNPIVVEDEQDAPKIGRRPVQHSSARAGKLPVPSSHEILATLVKQKNLYPVMDALLKLANNPYPPPPNHAQPAASGSNPPSYPATYQYPYYPYPHQYPYYYHYPYSYPYSYNAHSQPATPTTPTIPTTPPVPTFSTVSGSTGPPQKKRKLADVPAGAADWNVPYPFAAGQGPPGYQNNWEKQRQQQLLDDLVGLVKSAAKKAAAKKAEFEEGGSDNGLPIGSVEYYKERVLRHYRPQPTPGPSSLQPPLVPPASVQAAVPPRTTPSNVSSPPAVSPVVQAPSPSTTTPASNTVAEPPTPSTFSLPTTEESSESSSPADFLFDSTTDFSTDESTSDAEARPSLDDLLALFDDMPQGDLNALFTSSQLLEPAATHATPTFDNGKDLEADQSEETNVAQAELTDSSSIDASLLAMDPSLFAIDPALLAISFPSGMGSSLAATQSGARSHSQPVQVDVSAPGTASTSGTGAPPTPTLAGSPLSLSDLDPPTPGWDFTFPEPDVAQPSGEGAQVGERPEVGSSISDVGGVDLDEMRIASKDKGKGKATAQDLGMDVDMNIESPPPPSAATAAEANMATLNSAAALPPHLGRVPPRLETSYFAVPALCPPPPQFAIPSHRPAPSMPALRPVPPALQPKNREDTLKRARMMRAQIAAEIERAKVELWETTMEGGCLVVLAKEREKLASQAGTL